MPRYKYVGEESPINLAGVGRVKTNDVFPLNVAQAASVEKNDPENFQQVPDDTPLVSNGVPVEVAESTETPGDDKGSETPPAAPTKKDKKAVTPNKA